MMIIRPPHECPKCGAGSKVTQSKATAEKTYKRRQCTQCGEKWSSIEVTKEYFDLLVKLAKFVNDVYEEVKIDV